MAVIPATMTAIGFAEPGPPEVLRPETIAVPSMKNYAEQLFTTYLLPVQVVGLFEPHW